MNTSDSSGKKTVHLLLAQSGDYNQENFHTYYESLISYSEWGGKIFLGEKNTCRFCSEANPAKFLNNTSHTFPEFTGNKWLFSHDECKTCNSIFGVYETSLASYGHLMRSLSGIKGKQGVPTFQSGSKAIQIKNDGKFGVKVNVDKDKNHPPNEDLTFGLDFIKNEQTINLKFKQKSHVPLYLFKALAKIAFAIMPKDEIIKGGFEEFKDWIRRKDYAFSDNIHEPFFYICHNTLSLRPRNPFLILFKKRIEYADRNMPTFSLLFAYGSHIFQIFLPYYVGDKDFLFAETLDFPILPEIVTKNTDGKYKFRLMKGFELTKFEPKDFTFTAKGPIS